MSDLASLGSKPESVVYLSKLQAELVASLESWLNLAREGELLSFVGCGLQGSEDQVALMFHGAWSAAPFEHIGGLHAVATRLSEIALDHYDDSPRRA